MTPLIDRMVDGELSAAERHRAERHVAECPRCAEQLDQQTRLSQMLRNDLERYPAPDVLKARIRTALIDESRTAPAVPAAQSRAGRRWSSWTGIAAAAALIVATNVVTYSIARRARADDAVAADVMASHLRSLVPGHLVDVASNNQHNVKPWFNGRAPLSPEVPALDTSFNLIGGRLDYVGNHPAAVVVYGRRLHVINVFIWAEDGGDAGLERHDERGYHLLSWRQAGIRYWVASDLNETELESFVHAYVAGGR
jgi:anti-sigma factor RsiW